MQEPENVCKTIESSVTADDTVPPHTMYQRLTIKNKLLQPVKFYARRNL